LAVGVSQLKNMPVNRGCFCLSCGMTALLKPALFMMV